MSLDDSATDDLFELAMTAENWVQAEALADTDAKKRRAWLARKNKVRLQTASNYMHIYVVNVDLDLILVDSIRLAK